MNNSPIAVGNRRLLKLAAFLLTIPPEFFSFGEWCSDSKAKHLNVNKCGTTACAMGWATAIPTFKRLGLKLKDGQVFLPDGHGYNYRGPDTAMQLFHMPTVDAYNFFVRGWLGKSAAEIAEGLIAYVNSPVRESGKV